MAIIYANDGDLVRVMFMGKSYDFRISLIRATLADRDDPAATLGGDNVIRFRPEQLCEVCRVNDASDYQTGAGHNVCPACVNAGLEFQVARDIINNIGEYNDNLAKTIQLLEEDDELGRNSGHQYVESVSAGWDMVRGASSIEIGEVAKRIERVLFDAMVRSEFGG